MKYRLIGAEKAQHPVSLLCEVLGVSRSGFHAWLVRQPSKRWLSDVRLAELIHQVHAESDGTYGSPRVHAELRHRGVGWVASGSSGRRAATRSPGSRSGAGGRPRCECPACGRRPTWWAATSGRAGRTGCG
jgi:hypothetical protein